MKIFAMYDTKAQFYMQPFAELSTISALRGFEVAVNNSDSTFNRFPDDFCLMELAEFNQLTGQIIPHDAPQNLGSARTVLKNQSTNIIQPKLIDESRNAVHN